MNSETEAREAKPRIGGPDVSTKDLFSLDGRTIIITGGGGAMGLAVASSVVESGGDAICLDRQDAPPAEEWNNVLHLAQEKSTKLFYLSGDVTSADSVSQMFAKAVGLSRFPLRGLVTCAGISGECPAISYPLQAIQRIMDVNYYGTFMVAQAAAKEMRKQNVPGSMVLVASMSGTNSNKGVDTAAYNSSKAAVLQLGRSLAAEWGSRVGYPQIRVNTLSPGYIKTALTVGALEKPNREQEWSADNMLNRLSWADEYRGPVMFLLGDASSFMTGADLRVDGGHTAW